MSVTHDSSPGLSDRVSVNMPRGDSTLTLSRSELRRRIEHLSPGQRALLAERVFGSLDSLRSGPEQLIAWIVRAGPAVHPPWHRGSSDGDDEPPDEAGLATFLRERLPDHMVPSRFVFVDAIPRLPNGKVDVAALPDPIRAARDDDDFVPPRTEREEVLARVWASVLGVDRVSANDNFFELGGDSILSIQVVARAQRAGLQLTPDLVFEHQTLATLANAAQSVTPLVAPRMDITSAPLSPIQSWFFEQPIPSPHHWHQAVWLRPCPGFDRNCFERALRAVVARHDALRLRLRQEPSGWTQNLTNDPVTLRHMVLPGCTDSEFDALLERSAHDICAATDLGNGPLVHAAAFGRENSNVERVLLAAHHLVIDAVSWSILLDDLRAACDQDGSGNDLAPTTSFLSWCDALARVPQTGRLDDDAVYWAALPRGLPSLPLDHHGTFTEGSALTVTASLDEERTAHLLHDIHGAYNTNVEDALLTALARTLTDWAGQPQVLVGVERHGREPLIESADLSRTVGWLTSYFPFVLESQPAWDAGATLRTTKDHLRAIPHRGAGYGVLRYLGTALFGADTPATRDLAHDPAPEVIFNHAGRLDSLAGTTGGKDGPDGCAVWQILGPPFPSRAPENARTHRMEINTFVANGTLHVLWTASSEQYDRGTIESLVMRYVDELRALIAHGLSARTSGFTPADFPTAGLSQDALDRFLDGLSA